MRKGWCSRSAFKIGDILNDFAINQTSSSNTRGHCTGSVTACRFRPVADDFLSLQSSIALTSASACFPAPTVPDHDKSRCPCSCRGCPLPASHTLAFQGYKSKRFLNPGMHEKIGRPIKACDSQGSAQKESIRRCQFATAVYAVANGRAHRHHEQMKFVRLPASMQSLESAKQVAMFFSLASRPT